MVEFENQGRRPLEYSDTAQGPLGDEQEGIVKFILNYEKEIDKEFHILARETLNKEGKWEKTGDEKPIIDDDLRNLLKAKMNSYGSRLFLLSYLPDWNDAMRPAREVRTNNGIMLGVGWFCGKVRGTISDLKGMRDHWARMAESAFLQSLGGGTRTAIRQSARTVETIKPDTKEDKPKKFGIF